MKRWIAFLLVVCLMACAAMAHGEKRPEPLYREERTVCVRDGLLCASLWETELARSQTSWAENRDKLYVGWSAMDNTLALQLADELPYNADTCRVSLNEAEAQRLLGNTFECRVLEKATGRWLAIITYTITDASGICPQPQSMVY